ncbi:DUF1501 domain-containing protein [Shivajiella indica]|uniref:DUF1501 domain-containing protein n=1 Tax=Shivajiella indica TaxID=872115 RepID=A0ABW5B8E9_9BACT
MERRTFLKHVAHSLAIPGFLGSFSTTGFGRTLDNLLRLANDTDRALVLIYLEGGNDGLNTVIPLGNYGALTNVRPHVVMQESQLLEIPDTDFAFHPALSDLKSLYEEGRLQVIHSVGYPQQNFSHFRSMDIWMSGSDADQIVNSGWTGRYLEGKHPEFPEEYPNEAYPDPLAIEIGLGASMLFQGEKIGFSMVLNNVNSFYELLENEVDEAPEGPVGDKIRYIRLMAQQSQKYGRIVKDAAERITYQRPYPDNRLANQLKIVSRLIAGGLRTPLYLVRMGGFDTHDNQVEDSDRTLGRHANLLQTVNDSIMAFMKDLEYQGTADRVMGMTFSEFGRRIVSNSSLGTDHGSAAPMFIFGNMSEGKYLGNSPTIRGNEVYNDNLPLQFDFRQIYTSILSQWFDPTARVSMSANQNKTFEQVPVIKNALNATDNPKEELRIKIFPNPVQDFFTLEMDIQPGPVKVEIVDMSGRSSGKIFEGAESSYSFKRIFDISPYPPGRFVLVVSNGNKRYSEQLIKL